MRSSYGKCCGLWRDKYMKRLLALSLAVALVPGLASQQPRDTAEAARLRAQIEQRFAERVQDELKLTPDQASKLKASQERYGTRRRDLMQQQMQRRRALDDQMQPGVAANSDSVRKLMDGIQSGRAEMFKVEQDEEREMAGYLNPVQRARYQQMRERFMQRVMEMRQGRGQGMGKGMGRGVPGGRQGPKRRPI
jgi:Spy/CpxP family protein refolding chaperone